MVTLMELNRKRKEILLKAYPDINKLKQATLEELEKALAITSSGVNKVKARGIIERIKQLTVPLELISKNRRN